MRGSTSWIVEYAMALPTFMETWYQNCQTLLSAFCIFFANTIMLISAFVVRVCGKSSVLELPITSPTVAQSGMTGENGIINDGGTCQLSAGFARASRVARNRLAIYGENGLLDALEDIPPDTAEGFPGSWVEHVRESYITSNCPSDNTTITASSSSVDSHSVYSTPPPSIILNTPIITITGPSAHDYDPEDGPDYQSCDEDEYHSESANAAFDDAEQDRDDGSAITSKPALGNLARRRGFPGLPIITTFPPSHTLLSPLSVFQPRRSLDSMYRETPTDSNSSSSPGSASQFDSPSYSTPCYDEDPFSTHGDSYYSIDPSNWTTDVDDLTIYTTDESTERNMDISLQFDEYIDELRELTPAFRPKARILITNLYDNILFVPHEGRDNSIIPTTSAPSSPLSVNSIISGIPLLTQPVGDANRTPQSAHSVSTPSDDIATPYSNKKLLRPLTIANTDAHVRIVKLPNRRDRDIDVHWRFSFPYYPSPDSARTRSRTMTTVTAGLPLYDPPTISSSNSRPDDVHVKEVVSHKPIDATNLNVALSTPSTSKTFSPSSGDVPQSADLSSNNCCISNRPDGPLIPSDIDNYSGPLAALSSDISPKVLPGQTHQASGLADGTFFDRGRAVQAWISMVTSSPDSPSASGSDSKANSQKSHQNVESTLLSDKRIVEENLSVFKNGANDSEAGHQPPDEPSLLAPRRPKSLSSLSARAQAIALERHRSSVMYSSRRRPSDSPDRTPALRPLMLPIRLAFRDSLGRGNPISADGSLPDVKEGLSSSFVGSGDTTASETSSKESKSSSSHQTSQGSLDELLDALDLKPISDKYPNSQEPIRTNETSDAIVSFGIAL